MFMQNGTLGAAFDMSQIRDYAESQGWVTFSTMYAAAQLTRNAGSSSSMWDIYYAAKDNGLDLPTVASALGWIPETFDQWLAQRGGIFTPTPAGNSAPTDPIYDYGAASGSQDQPVSQRLARFRPIVIDNGWFVFKDSVTGWQIVSQDAAILAWNLAQEMKIEMTDIDWLFGWNAGTFESYVNGTLAGYDVNRNEQLISMIRADSSNRGWIGADGYPASQSAALDMITYANWQSLSISFIESALNLAPGTIQAYAYPPEDSSGGGVSVPLPQTPTQPSTYVAPSTPVPQVPNSSGPASNAGTVSYGVDSSGFLVSLPPGSVVAVPGSTQQPAQPGVMTMVNANGPTVNAQGAPVAPTRQAAGGSLLLAVLAALSFLN